MSKKAQENWGNIFHDIEQLDLSDEQKQQVLEYLANKYWKLLLDLGVQDGHCKSYDPLVIEGKTAHTYVFDLEDGGRHHTFKDYKDLERMLDEEILGELKGETKRSKWNELKAKNIFGGSK